MEVTLTSACINLRLHNLRGNKKSTQQKSLTSSEGHVVPPAPGYGAMSSYANHGLEGTSNFGEGMGTVNQMKLPTCTAAGVTLVTQLSARRSIYEVGESLALGGATRGASRLEPLV